MALRQKSHKRFENEKRNVHLCTWQSYVLKKYKPLHQSYYYQLSIVIINKNCSFILSRRHLLQTRFFTPSNIEATKSWTSTARTTSASPTCRPPSRTGRGSARPKRSWSRHSIGKICISFSTLTSRKFYSVNRHMIRKLKFHFCCLFKFEKLKTKNLFCKKILSVGEKKVKHDGPRGDRTHDLRVISTTL